MSGESVGCGGSSATTKGSLFSGSSRSRYDLNRTGSLLSVIVSRKLNATHDIRIDRPSSTKLTPISANESLTDGHLPAGQGQPV